VLLLYEQKTLRVGVRTYVCVCVRVRVCAPRKKSFPPQRSTPINQRGGTCARAIEAYARSRRRSFSDDANIASREFPRRIGREDGVSSVTDRLTLRRGPFDIVSCAIRRTCLFFCALFSPAPYAYPHIRRRVTLPYRVYM